MPLPRPLILVVDNRDSYTYNLVQILRALLARPDGPLPGAEVRVVGADEPEAARDALADPALAGVVISPGPGHPARAADFAVSGEVVDAVLARGEGDAALPLLGVCLGHQGLALRFGWDVVPAPAPRHGWISPLRHTGAGLFVCLPQSTHVTRYHSLAIRPGAAPDARLTPTAWSEDGVVQAFEIAGTPWHGVQFHPESIASEHGADLLGAWLGEVGARWSRRAAGVTTTTAPRADEAPSPGPAAGGAPDDARADARPPLHVRVATLTADDLHDLGLDLRAACRAVYAGAVRRGRASFWLDSSRTDVGEARWSVLGDAEDALPDRAARVLREDLAPGDERDHAAGLWARLAEAAAPREVSGGEGLPFRGGLVGFLGYETGMASLGVATPTGDGPQGLPAAFWARPARWAVADHATGALHVCVGGEHDSALEDALQAWAGRVRAALSGDADGRTRPGVVVTETAADPGGASQEGEAEIPGTWRHDRDTYRGLVEQCQAALVAGESYELCLTSRFDVAPGTDVDPLVLFLDLAEHHPTPYAALIEMDPDAARDDGDAPARGGFAVVSASPEQFLSGTDGVYSTKPIKGTAARHADPVDDAAAAESLTTDPKTYAENLMIVDLLRNDLGRVCEPGSMHVPALMQVESFASVHQLVSTVVGRAEPGVTPVDVVRALFPGGSMTGAPKLRSVQLLAGLEAAPRGVYSGALGLLGADGRTELNIVIRTAVRDAAGAWSVGAGGAVVLDSDPGAEHDEVLLKARSVRAAMRRVAR